MQVLFFEQERGSKENTHKLPPPELISKGKQAPTVREDQYKLKLGSDEKFSRGEGIRRTAVPGTGEKDQHKSKRSDGKLTVALERKLVIGEIEEVESEKGKEIKEEGMSRSKLDPKKMIPRGSRSDHSRDKGRDR